MLTVLSLAVGVLSAVALLPIVGVAGVAVRDAAKTFNDLPVKGLSEVPSRSELVDSSGHLLAYYYPGFPHPIYRVPVHYNQISPLMRQAIVSIEDARFWTHGALDVHGTLRAISLDLSGRAVQGGSDLAQQYVKNACILTANTKTEQAVLRVGHPVAKDQRAAQRGPGRARHDQGGTADRLSQRRLLRESGLWRPGGGSQRYFSTSAKHLTLTEAAMLAGLVENPVGYDPLTNPKAALDAAGHGAPANAEAGLHLQGDAGHRAEGPAWPAPVFGTAADRLHQPQGPATRPSSATTCSRS